MDRVFLPLYGTNEHKSFVIADYTFYSSHSFQKVNIDNQSAAYKTPKAEKNAPKILDKNNR